MSTGIFSIPRPNWIEIDLDALQHNIATLRSLIPATCKLLLPVKADAYGHGSLAISHTAVHAGIDWLGVAHLFEGILLRQHGIRVPILILGTVDEGDFPFLQQFKLTPSFADVQVALKYAQWLAPQKMVGTIHLKIDTGMHRYGIAYHNSAAILAVLQNPYLKVEGIFSHIANADISGHSANTKQIEAFMEVLNLVESQGYQIPLAHLANSAGLLSKLAPTLGMVRPGIATYGYNPLANTPHPLLRPVLRMKSTVRQVRTIAAGESVSYGFVWTAKRDTKVATVAIGYGDGYMRSCTNSGVMYIKNTPCAIIGRVCMDAVMLDVTHIADLEPGEIVDVINGELSPNISLEAISAHSNTIAYEIVTRVARRLYRQYVFNGQMLKWHELKDLLQIPDFCEQPTDLFT